MYIIIAIVIITLILIGIGVYFFKERIERFYFLPDTETFTDELPPGIREVQISRGGKEGTLYGLLKERGDKIVLYCHGNAGNIYNRVKRLNKFDSGVLLFDYSGFGKSTGIANVANVLNDAEFAYKYLLDLGYESDNIILYGESIGCPIASSLCIKYPVPKLILQSGPSSINNVVNFHVPYLGSLMWIIMDDLNTDKFLKRIGDNTKVMIMHSPEDLVVPYSCAEKLKKHAHKFITIGGGHNQPKIDYSLVNSFVAQM